MTSIEASDFLHQLGVNIDQAQVLHLIRQKRILATRAASGISYEITEVELRRIAMLRKLSRNELITDKRDAVWVLAAVEILHKMVPLKEMYAILVLRPGGLVLGSLLCAPLAKKFSLANNSYTGYDLIVNDFFDEESFAPYQSYRTLCLCCTQNVNPTYYIEKVDNHIIFPWSIRKEKE